MRQKIHEVFSNDGGWFKPVDELTFADDFMFGKVMENKEICKKVLEILLGIKIDDIQYPKLQEVLNPCYDNKSIRLYVFAEDSERVFDIEITAKIASRNFCLRVFDKQKLAN